MRYLKNLLLAIDQLANTIIAGDPDETISSRIGRIKRDFNGRIPWRRPVFRVTDRFLDGLDRNHSIDSIELDEGDAGCLDRPRRTPPKE
jgi:hypothetical protein